MATARHIAYGGARGGGKSWAMRRKFVLLALKYAGLRLLLLRRTLPELRENHVLPLMAELAGFAKYREDEKAFILPNGSRIKLGYCDTERDVYQYQGQEYDVIGLEEATHFTESQKDFLTTCNRSTRTDFKPRMYYTANPGNVGHTWFKRLFIDRDYRGSERPEDYVFIPARVYDNKVLMDTNPEYVQTLENLPEDLRRAHLEGDWDSFIGQVFREFRREVHVCRPFSIPADWRRWRAIDYGYSAPACCLWFAIAPDETVYVYRELYVTQVRAAELAQKIIELSRGEDVIYTYADPSMWNKTGHEGESIEETMRQYGLLLDKADNDRLHGKQRVHDYLTVFEGSDGRPRSRLQIFESCINLIRTLPQLVYDERKVEDVDTSGEDHAYDALRYGLMQRPAPKLKKKLPRSVPRTRLSQFTGW
jgi:phage terminase large subunit